MDNKFIGKIEELVKYLYKHAFYLILGLLQILSGVATGTGLYLWTDSKLMAIIGGFIVQAFFTLSWHRIFEDHDLDGETRKSHALVVAGIVTLAVSGYASSLGFFRATKEDSTKARVIKEHNFAELEAAKRTFIEIKDTAVKTLNEQINENNSEKKRKTAERATTTGTNAKAANADIRRLSVTNTELEKSVKAVLSQSYPQDALSASLSEESEVLTALEEVSSAAGQIAATAKIELSNNEKWMGGLTYQRGPEEDSEQLFLSDMKKGSVSSWLMLALGFGVDFLSILVLLCNRRPRKLKILILQTRTWARELLGAFGKHEVPAANTPEREQATSPADTTASVASELPEEPPIVGNRADIEPVKLSFVVPNPIANEKPFLFRVQLPALTSQAIREKLAIIKDTLRETYFLNFLNLVLPEDWRSTATAGRPIELIGQVVERSEKNAASERPATGSDDSNTEKQRSIFDRDGESNGHRSTGPGEPLFEV